MVEECTKTEDVTVPVIKIVAKLFQYHDSSVYNYNYTLCNKFLLFLFLGTKCVFLTRYA